MAARRLPKTASSSLGSPLQSIEQALFPIGYKLLVGTSQIYELELALAESKVLSREDLLLRGAYFESIDGLKTHHFRMCAVSPLQVDSASSARRRTFFEANLFKTGYATHGLFPYRGKFHPQLIKAVVKTGRTRRNQSNVFFGHVFDIDLDRRLSAGGDHRDEQKQKSERGYRRERSHTSRLLTQYYMGA